MELFRAETIPVGRYLISRGERLRPYELVEDELVVLMMALRRRKAVIAVELPTVINEVQDMGENLYQVDFEVYDSSMKRIAELRDRFTALGYWERPTLQNRWIDDENRVITGYFWDTDLGLEEEIRPLGINYNSPVG